MSAEEQANALVSAHEAGWVLLDQIIKQHDLATACLKIVGQGESLVEQLTVQMRQKHDFAPTKVKTITSNLLRDIIQTARNTEKTEFWLLCNNTIVALCGALESMAKDVAAYEITRSGWPDSDAQERKFKFSAHEFLTMNPHEKARIIVDRVFDEERTRNGYGSRLEAILSICTPFKVDTDIKLAVDEAYEMRNAIVHRGALFDRKLVAKLPRFEAEIGRPIRIVGADFNRYRKSIQEFASEISCRNL